MFLLDESLFKLWRNDIVDKEEVLQQVVEADRIGGPDCRWPSKASWGMKRRRKTRRRMTTRTMTTTPRVSVAVPLAVARKMTKMMIDWLESRL